MVNVILSIPLLQGVLSVIILIGMVMVLRGVCTHRDARDGDYILAGVVLSIVGVMGLIWC